MSRQAKPWFNREKSCWMVWWEGKRKRLAAGPNNRTTRKQAEQRLLQLRYEAQFNPAPGSGEPTVASVLEAYQASALQRLAASTVATAKPYLQSFAEAHGWRTVREVTLEHLESWLSEHPEWVSDWTKNFAVRQIKTAFNWALNKSKMISGHPFVGYSPPEGEARRDVTPEEFQTILRASGNRGYRKRPTPSARFRQICVFLWFTGCRPGEAAKLEWRHVDFKRNRIVLPEHKTARRQKRPGPRIIPLHPVMVRLLTWIRNLKQPGDHVFLTHRKTPWNKNTLCQRLHRARRLLSIPKDAKLYGMRHAFGTRGVTSGAVDLKTLAQLMGHTTTRMTEHYLHLAGQDAHLAAAMLRVNAPRRGA
jgi:integrase